MGTDDLTNDERSARRVTPPARLPALDPLAGQAARAALVAELRSLVASGSYEIAAEVIAVAIYSNATGRWEEHLI
jgi:anti-sigma28 factor (negative regulator of flagellin synthesis)